MIPHHGPSCLDVAIGVCIVLIPVLLWLIHVDRQLVRELRASQRWTESMLGTTRSSQ